MSVDVQASSPGLLDVEYGSVLFLGGTGTGKTFGLKIILKQLLDLQKHATLYTINVKDSEYAVEFKKQHVATKFEKIESFRRGSVVVVEDIIDLNTKEEIALRQLLNWHAHHKKLKVFCVSHNIFKTKLYNTLSYFKFVIFTSSLGNLFVLGKCLAYHQLEPEIVEGVVERVKAFGGARGVYFYFDTARRKVFATNNLTNSGSARLLGDGNSSGSNLAVQNKKTEKMRATLQQRFELFFRGHKIGQQAGAVFSIINHCVESGHIDPVDLSLKFASRQGGQKNVSLVDYVHCLLTENHPVQPDQLVLHKFVQTKCNIPKFFLVNNKLANS
jgi:hypothetical protein